MSSSCTISISGFPVLNYSNCIPDIIFNLFNVEKDLHVIRQDPDEGDLIYLESTIKNARERFSIKKCVTLDEVRQLYELSRFDVYDFQDNVDGSEKQIIAHIKKFHSFKKWVVSIRKILESADYFTKANKSDGGWFNNSSFVDFYEVMNKKISRTERIILNSLLFQKTIDSYLGCPENFKEDYLIKAFLELSDDDWIIRCDLSDVVLSGYANLDDLKNDKSQKAILLGEGTSDIFFIKNVFEIIKPELLDCFYFTEEKEFTSGCSSLAQYLIVFNNINIKENVIGVFDNDAEGSFSYELAKKKVKLPNIHILKLPVHDDFKNYPYISVDNKIRFCNIDSKAISTELFYPDSIIRFNGDFCPISWSNFNKNNNLYQGRISRKDEVQKLWENKYKEIKKNNYIYDKNDFRRATFLIETIVDTFTFEHKRWINLLYK